MSKTMSFARHGTLLSVLCLLCAPCWLAPAHAQDDPLNPHLTAHLTNVPFADALRILGLTAGMKIQMPPDLAAQLNPGETYNVDISDGSLSQALDYLLDQVDPPLAYHVENGAFVLEASKTPRVGKAVKKPRVILHNTFSIKDLPFENALSYLFRSASSRYRIDPAVTAYLDPVTSSIDDATLDEKLAALLAAVPGQKTPLVSRKEKDIYIIAPKDKTALPNLNTTPVGLPSYHPDPTIKAVAISNEHPGAALLQMFTQAGVNYHFVQPSSVADTPRITFAMRGVPLEQAIVHLLRSAPTEPPLHLGVFNTPEDKQAALYSVGPEPNPLMRGASAPVYHHWFGFHNYDLYTALKALLASANRNYTIDPGLRAVKVTATGSDLPFEEALGRLVAASSMPVKFRVRDGVYEFTSTNNAPPPARP